MRPPDLAELRRAQQIVKERGLTFSLSGHDADWALDEIEQLRANEPLPEDRAIRILATLEASQRELSTIRATCERVLRINPDDTTAELVARLVYLAAPESAGKTWFLNWQRAEIGRAA